MTIDTNTSEALDLAQQILTDQTRDAQLAAQEKILAEERAAIAVRLQGLRERFSRLIVNGTAKASPVRPASAPASAAVVDDNNDDTGDDEEDEEHAENGESDEANESHRAQVLAFYASQPGKKIPLPLAIEKLPDVPQRRVRDYSAKFATPGGPLKRVRRGVYRYVGRVDEDFPE